MSTAILTFNDCNKIIAKCTNNIQQCESYVIKKKSDEVLGFLGDHYVLIIDTFSKITGEKSQHNFFVKTMPELSLQQMEYVKSLNAFEKESRLYKTILPEFQKYFDEPFVPECFLIKTNSLIVLEDLSAKDYKIKEDYLNYYECESILKALAKLHSASVIFEEIRSVPFVRYKINEHFPDELIENLFVLHDEEHPRKKWLNAGMTAIYDCLRLVPHYEDKWEISAKLSAFVANDLHEFVKPSLIYRNVICHADLWKNNALFKTNRKDQIQCTLVDFQLARYSPPAFDILITLYLNLSAEDLEKNMANLLNTYYNEFCKNLQLHNIEPNEIMSLNDFMESIISYKLPSAIVAALYAIHVFAGDGLTKLITTNDTVFQEFTLINRSKYVCNEFRKNETYRQKCTDAFKKLVDALSIKLDVFHNEF